MKRANFFITTIFFLVGLANLNWEGAHLFYGVAYAQKPQGAAADKPDPPQEPSDAQKYRIAKDFIEAGETKKAREMLAPLAGKTFILGDYAAKDLASIMVSNGMKTEALKTLDNIERSFPRSPFLKEVNEQRLRLACEEPVWEGCGKRLMAIGRAGVAKKFRPYRELFIAKRLGSEGKLKQAYKMYQKLYYSHPASRAGLEAGIQIERIKIENKESKKLKLPYPTYSMRIKRVDRLMKAYRYTDAVKELETVLTIQYSTARKAKAYILLGEARYKARDKIGAKETLLSFIEKYADHSRRTAMEYKIAIIDWNLDNNEQCAIRLKKLIASGASANIQKLSHAVLGKIAESRNDYGAAKEHYTAALKLRLGQKQKHDITWRLAWLEYQKGDYSDAAKAFGTAARKIDLRYRNGKYLYWKAKSLEKIGDAKGSQKAIKELERIFPNTFYGTKTAYADPGIAKTLRPDEMNSFYETVDKIGDRLKFNNRAKYHRKRFDILIGARLFSHAATELGSLKKYGPKGGGAAIWIALQYRKAMASSKSIRLITDSSAIIKHSFNFKTPFWRLLYPVDHWEVALAQANDSALDPFFIMAIIRQESAFNPKALSPANARGLMQIISSVGAREFAMGDFAGYSGVGFSSEMLFDPELNISIGVKHIAGLVKKYNGNMVYVAAAYNAGAKRVGGWLERFKGIDEDMFIELIPYPETQKYVKLVLRNLALYRMIYGEG